jgi:hypothetical protein
MLYQVLKSSVQMWEAALSADAKSFVSYSSGLGISSVIYSYDKAGRRVSESNAYNGSGTPPSNLPTTKYGYDAADRMTVFTDTSFFVIVHGVK